MIIPALDLINGNVVRLHQGCYHKKVIYHGDPITYLKDYFYQGAEIVHLVDLDGAQNPMNRQTHLLNQLLRTNPQKKIQVGGGVRCTKDIDHLLKQGATRVVFSSQGIEDPYLTKKWFEYFGSESLVLALDTRINSQGIYKIIIHGWQKSTSITLQDMLQEYCSIGLKHVLCTDISKDGTLKGSNVKLYATICKTWPNIAFQSSGGVNNLKEIRALRKAGIASIIIGRAFLEKKFTIKEAILCWQNELFHA